MKWSLTISIGIGILYGVLWSIGFETAVIVGLSSAIMYTYLNSLTK